MALGDLMGMLAQYAGGSTNTGNESQDFDHISQNASSSHLANGLAGAFRSDQTPPFPQMIGNLFSQSNRQQQAGILSKLIGAVGPSALPAGILSSLGGRHTTEVTPEQAQQMSPQDVHELAQRAEQSDPSIINQASSFYAEHPTLVKALGAGALAMVMSHMSRSNQ